MYTPFDQNYAYDPVLSRDPLRMTRNRLLQRISEPASEAITLTEAKLYMRIDNTNDDTLISDLIIAARAMAENWLRRSLISQTWKLAYDFGIADSIWLPMGPLSSVTSVVIVNQDTTTLTVDPTSYWLSAAQNSLNMYARLIGFRIEVTYNTGYGDATKVPKPIKQGMLSHIAAMYDSRGEAGQDILPEQAVGLYYPYKEVRL